MKQVKKIVSLVLALLLIATSLPNYVQAQEKDAVDTKLTKREAQLMKGFFKYLGKRDTKGIEKYIHPDNADKTFHLHYVNDFDLEYTDVVNMSYKREYNERFDMDNIYVNLTLFDANKEVLIIYKGQIEVGFKDYNGTRYIYSCNINDLDFNTEVYYDSEELTDKEREDIRKKLTAKYGEKIASTLIQYKNRDGISEPIKYKDAHVYKDSDLITGAEVGYQYQIKVLGSKKIAKSEYKKYGLKSNPDYGYRLVKVNVKLDKVWLTENGSYDKKEKLSIAYPKFYGSFTKDYGMNGYTIQGVNDIGFKGCLKDTFNKAVKNKVVTEKDNTFTYNITGYIIICMYDNVKDMNLLITEGTLERHYYIK